MTTLYGIKNCDTVKKAKRWLDDEGVAYEFHDFRSDGLSKDTLKAWVETVGFEKLVNNRSTTWRQLPSDDKDNLNETKAVNLMLANPTLIKRPVLVADSEIIVGFKAENYQEKLS